MEKEYLVQFLENNLIVDLFDLSDKVGNLNLHGEVVFITARLTENQMFCSLCPKGLHPSIRLIVCFNKFYPYA